MMKHMCGSLIIRMKQSPDEEVFEAISILNQSVQNVSNEEILKKIITQSDFLKVEC